MKSSQPPLSVTLACILASVATGQSGHLAPEGPEFPISTTGASEYWIRAAVAEDGRFAFTFNGANDVSARFFDANGVALTPNQLCHPGFTNYIQDECEIAVCPVSGNYLVAFNDRAGHDGEQMGIYGRIFDRDGVPLGGEFQINEVWQASQWRPLIAARPAGGWIVSWSGDWDGDAVMRIVDCDGSFLSGDIGVNTFDANAQVDTTHAIAPDGTMMVVFVDYSAHGGVGSGTNLWGRLFDQDGTPLQASETHLNTPAFSAGDQREPRVAVDSAGRFFVVWQDQLADGSGYGIVGRLFGPDMTPIGPELLVNTNTLGEQRNPRPVRTAFDHWAIVWEDGFGGDFDVKLRRFDNDGNPVTGEVVVHDLTGGDQDRPGIGVDSMGAEVLVCWETPGSQTDVYGRFFGLVAPPVSYCTSMQNSLGCVPTIGSTGTPQVGSEGGFHVTATGLLSQKNGLMFWGTDSAALPFNGGFLCVRQPITRTPLQSSGGSLAPDCSGAFSFPFTAAYATSKGLAPGATVHAQYWSRDPQAPSTVHLTDALSFELGP